jgi:hypothetical protein
VGTVFGVLSCLSTSQPSPDSKRYREPHVQLPQSFPYCTAVSIDTMAQVNDEVKKILDRQLHGLPTSGNKRSSIFSFASRTEIAILVLSSLCAIAAGVLFPIMTVSFVLTMLPQDCPLTRRRSSMVNWSTGSMASPLELPLSQNFGPRFRSSVYSTSTWPLLSSYSYMSVLLASTILVRKWHEVLDMNI